MAIHFSLAALASKSGVDADSTHGRRRRLMDDALEVARRGQDGIRWINKKSMKVWQAGALASRRARQSLHIIDLLHLCSPLLLYISHFFAADCSFLPVRMWLDASRDGIVIIHQASRNRAYWYNRALRNRYFYWSTVLRLLEYAQICKT